MAYLGLQFLRDPSNRKIPQIFDMAITLSEAVRNGATHSQLCAEASRSVFLPHLDSGKDLWYTEKRAWRSCFRLACPAVTTGKIEIDRLRVIERSAA